MFQIIDCNIPAKQTLVLDDKLKTQYKGIKGITVWTPDYNQLRQINIELKLDSKEVFPPGFPTEIFSVNPFRNVEDCTLTVDFPAMSRIEGNILNGNDTEVVLKLILFIKQ